MKTFLLAGFLAIIATMAFAHSGRPMTTPEDGAVLAETPPQVVLIFAKGIRMTRVRLTHDDQPAVNLDLGDQKAFANRFVVPMTNMGGGLYRIEWRGLAADGHTMRDALTFRVE